MNGPRKQLEDFDLFNPENEQYFTKLIFFKIKKSDHRWHICLPELTVVEGFVAFCGGISWAEIDTQDRQRLNQVMQRERSEFCERCAEEFVIAFHELKRQGYLTQTDVKPSVW